MRILCQISRKDLKEKLTDKCAIEKGGSVNKKPTQIVTKKLAAVLHQFHIDDKT